MNKKTLRVRVAELMYERRTPWTATRLQDALGFSGEPVKLSSLSSLLKKMCDAGLLLRVSNVGPRGGNGYIDRPGSHALRELAGLPPRPPAFVSDNPVAELYLNHAGYREDK